MGQKSPLRDNLIIRLIRNEHLQTNKYDKRIRVRKKKFEAATVSSTKSHGNLTDFSLPIVK